MATVGLQTRGALHRIGTLLEVHSGMDLIGGASLYDHILSACQAEQVREPAGCQLWVERMREEPKLPRQKRFRYTLHLELTSILGHYGRILINWELCLQVIDDEGVERTPKPMLSLKPSVMHHNMSGFGPEESGTPTSEMSDNFLERMSSTGFSRGMFSASGTASPDMSEEGDDSRKLGQNSMLAANTPGIHSQQLKDVEEEAVMAVPEMLTERDLEKQVHVTLEETETMWLLDLNGVCVASGTPEAEEVQKGNQAYAKLLESKVSGDKFNDGEMQTINAMRKTREVQTNPFSTTSTASQASRWEINDMYEGTDSGKDQEDTEEPATVSISGNVGPKPDSRSSTHRKSGRKEGMDGMIDRSSMISTTSAGLPPNRDSTMSIASMVSMAPRESGASDPSPSGVQESTVEAEKPDPLASLPDLIGVINLVDAAIMQNIYLDKLILYRDIKVSSTSTEEENTHVEAGVGRTSTVSSVVSTAISKVNDGASTAGDEDTMSVATDLEGRPEMLMPRMELLWEWSCDVTDGYNVSCIGWNKVQQDFIAAGYGDFRFRPGNQTGVVAFWSLKNPEYPQWTFKTHTGVTALDFSSRNPNILATGMYDGTVAMYDIQSKSSIPVMESQENAGKHPDPVWQVKWLDRGADREEVLISISTDGRVTQWSITKGLEYTDLMKLKRVARKATNNPKAKNAAASNVNQVPFISRLTSGMSFDFSHIDPRIYIAGTEDGWIHKCSTSYSEQYLESYSGHMGPVYSTRWSPFKPGLFLSCSADWTMKLWMEGRENALLTFTTSNDEINDVHWCPNNSTVFGCVTTGGRLEIWDISLSTMKPVAHHVKAGAKLSCLLFSEKSPIVVCGSDNGVVGVYRMFNIERREDSFTQHAERLDEVMRMNVMKAQAAI
ncbi:hypothetical protein BSKO_07733 [Bryopsis sp. KO-2023]|nr:hypothetical protein BSKO_07733 [Bryopsis sp. KO-2023]